MEYTIHPIASQAPLTTILTDVICQKITESPLGPKDWTLQKGQDLIVGAISVGDLGKVQGGAA